MPRATVEEKLAIVHVNEVIDDFVMVPVWGVEEH